MAEEAIWYLGPMGEMRPLVTPDPGISINEVRFGGVHTGIGGGRTVDTTGVRTDYELSISYLDREDHDFIRALYYRSVPGPHYLLDPLHRNRLTAQASVNRIAYYEGMYGLYKASDKPVYSTDRPEDAPYPGKSLDVQPPERIHFSSGVTIPLMPDEPTVFSVWLKSADTNPVTGTLQMDWYTADDVLNESTTHDYVADGSWYRHSWSFAPRLNDTGVRPILNHDGPIKIAFPQYEPGDVPTDFMIGGGCRRVSIDQIEGESPRYPLTSVSLKLIEV